VPDHPIAAAALELLLAATAASSVESALVTESATYSTLQAGPEHQTWLAARVRQERPADRDVVLVARDGDTLRLTLNRPHVRNAFNAAMREALLDGLEIAALDASVERVVIDGAGDNFCSGGDLDEFGTLADPATAHLLRVERNVGRAVHELRERVTFVVHGACIGAGVELPAFAARVIARPDATFRLPEIGMGLVPGAGGTVSIPRRIGRERFRAMALTGDAIDATTALAWGLVDEIAPPKSSAERHTSVS
jgi:enoyl-CoA hydratase/carnithine racemase